MTDMVIGVDFHTVTDPARAADADDAASVLRRHLPVDDAGFPKINMLINGMPACATGAMGYSVPHPAGHSDAADRCST